MPHEVMEHIAHAQVHALLAIAKHLDTISDQMHWHDDRRNHNLDNGATRIERAIADVASALRR